MITLYKHVLITVRRMVLILMLELNMMGAIMVSVKTIAGGVECC